MKKILALFVVGMMIIGLTGCSTGVPREEYDAVVKENERLEARIESLSDGYMEDATGGAIESVFGDVLGQAYTCTIGGKDYLQYSVQIETDENSIKNAFDTIMTQLKTAETLVSEVGGLAGAGIEQYDAFYIKAVDSNNMTVFEMSYHPNSDEMVDISIGAMYAEEVVKVSGSILS